MAKRLLLNYLYGTVAQGGADAFAQALISTPIVTESGFAAVLREILFDWGRIPPGAAANFEFALYRKSLAAMPGIDEKSLVYKAKRTNELQTSGSYLEDMLGHVQYSEENAPLIVESSIYAAIDSNATGLTQSIKVRLGYTLEKISDVDRLSIIAASLQQ